MVYPVCHPAHKKEFTSAPEADAVTSYSLSATSQFFVWPTRSDMITSSGSALNVVTCVYTVVLHFLICLITVDDSQRAT
jgi:hypothetical protein